MTVVVRAATDKRGIWGHLFGTVQTRFAIGISYDPPLAKSRHVGCVVLRAEGSVMRRSMALHPLDWPRPHGAGGRRRASSVMIPNEKDRQNQDSPRQRS
jgi:hypothetical protein